MPKLSIIMSSCSISRSHWCPRNTLSWLFCHLVCQVRKINYMRMWNWHILKAVNEINTVFLSTVFLLWQWGLYKWNVHSVNYWTFIYFWHLYINKPVFLVVNINKMDVLGFNLKILCWCLINNFNNFSKVLLIYVKVFWIIIKNAFTAPLMEHLNRVWITPLRNWHEKSLGQRTVLSDPVWWSWRQRGSKEKSRCVWVKSLWGAAPALFDVAQVCCCWCTPVKMFLWQLETQSASLSQRNLRDPAWPSVMKQRYEGLDPELENSVGLRWWQIMSTDLLKTLFTKQIFFPYTAYTDTFFPLSSKITYIYLPSRYAYITFSVLAFLGKQSHNLSIILWLKIHGGLVNSQF